MVAEAEGEVDEVDAKLIAFAREKGAWSFNLYFLVATGRGEGMRGLEPAENEAVLTDLVELERVFRTLKSDVDRELVFYVQEHQDEFPGVTAGEHRRHTERGPVARRRGRPG